MFEPFQAMCKVHQQEFRGGAWYLIGEIVEWPLARCNATSGGNALGQRT